MARPSSRAVVFLCVLLLLQEFGPAQFARVHPLPRPTLRDEQDSDESQQSTDDHENEEQEKVIDEPEDDGNEGKDEKGHANHEEKHHKASKRGFGGLLKNGIKLLKFGNQVLPKLVTIASISNTVFRAIAGCCSDYPKACEGHKEIETLRVEVEQKSNELDDIELEAKSIQEWTESTSDKFAFVLFELNTIVDNAEVFANSLSPEVTISMANRTKEINSLVRKKNAAGEKLDYLEAQSMYMSTLDTVLGITIPIFASILPGIPGMVNFAKKRLGVKKTYTLDHSLDGALAKPPGSSPKAASVNSWMAKTKAGITNKMNAYREKINTKYGGAVGIFKKVSAGLALIFGYVSSAYGIYNIVKSAQNCKAKQEKVLEALDEFKSANKMLDEAIANATKSKEILDEAWKGLHKSLSEEALLKDLGEVKKVVESVAEKSPDLQAAVVKVQNYINNVAGVSDYKELFDLVTELATGLTSIPFTLNCYTNKIKMADYVLRGCRRGEDSFDALYNMGLTNFDTNADECKDKVGFTYLEKSEVGKGLAQMAEKEGFSSDCILNSLLRKTQACDKKNEGYSNEDIAKMLNITTKQVQALTENCPKRGLTPNTVNQICNLRKLNLNNKQIATSLGLDESAVEGVQCPS